MSSHNLAARLEDAFLRRSVPALRRRGWRPALHVLTSYGTQRRARVLARVVMTDPLHDPSGTLIRELPGPGATRQELAAATVQGLRDAQRGWRQFLGTTVPFYPVTITLGQATVTVHADRVGLVDVVVEGHDLTPGPHLVQITGPASPAQCGLIQIIDDSTTYGIVCDIDDTIMVTHLPRPLVAAWNAFVKYTHTREAVPGMAELLTEFSLRHPQAPIIYLSTGAWNVQQTLSSFMSRHGIPAGPMLLTDWGPTNTGWFRSGQEHKRTQLRRLLIDLPQIQWLLIGDDGQHDPLIYAELAREHRPHVGAIAIRQLSPTEQVMSHFTAEPLTVYGPASVLQAAVPQVYGSDGFELRQQLSHVF